MLRELWKKDYRGKIYLMYSIVFILSFLIIFSGFFFFGKSFLLEPDGATQHALFMRDYVSLIKEFLSGGRFDFWNWNLGLGADTIISYGYYSIFDPVTVIAYILPAGMTELSYALMIFVRLYLTGLFFLIYIKSMGVKSEAAQLFSSFVYVFSFVIIYSSFRHPMFINGPMMLPLIALGTEKMLKGKRPYLLIAAAFYALIAQFYMFVYASVFFECYLFARYFALNGKMPFGKWFKKIFAVNACYLLGALLGGFLLFPEFLGVLGGSRASSKGFIMYGVDFYALFVPSLYLPLPHTTYSMAAGNIFFFIIACLFTLRKGTEKWVKTMYFGGLGLMAVSLFGYAMSLFSYANNRWSYVLALPLAYMAAKVFDDYESYRQDSPLLKKTVCLNGLLIAATLLFATVYAFTSFGGVWRILVPLAGLAAALGFGLTVYFKRGKVKAALLKLRLPAKKTAVVLTAAFTLTSLFVYNTAIASFYPDSTLITTSYQHMGNFNRRYQTEPDYALNSIEPGFYRSAKTSFAYNRQTLTNDSLYNGYKSIYLYNSMSSSSINRMIDFFNVNNGNNTIGYNGFDNRAILDSLASVKYYALREATPDLLPYGYELLSSDGNAYIYRNGYSLPFGFVSGHVIGEEDAAKLSPLKRMSLLQNNIIAPQEIAADFAAAQALDSVKTLDSSVLSADGVTMKKNSLTAEYDGASIVFTLPEITDAELYAEIKNLSYENPSIFTVGFTAKTSKSERTHEYGSAFYVDNPDYLVNAGYYGGRNENVEITLTFDRAGRYDFDSISFYAFDMTEFADSINELRGKPLENVVIDKNNVKGDITLQEKGVLFLSMPHEKGWTAYVNGKVAETFDANIGYTGIVLDAGYSGIELKYATPYWREGLIVSAAALAALAAMTAVLETKKRLAAKKPPEETL